MVWIFEVDTEQQNSKNDIGEEYRGLEEKGKPRIQFMDGEV